MYRSLTIIGLSATLGLTACSGSGTNPAKVTTQNLGSNVLQLSVGTANIYGDLGTAGYVGLNVVSTYRQSKTQLAPGDSAVAVSTPSISGPFTLLSQVCITSSCGGPGTAYSTIGQGPAPVEINTGSITATGQTSTTNTTFGTAGGATGLGIEPFNFNSEGGTPYSYIPYVVPAYDPAGDTNFFSPEGYPPAFPSTATGPNPAYSEGLDVFAQVPPVKGTYTLADSVPIANAPSFNTSTTATLKTSHLLPAFVQSAPSLDTTNDGGATFPVTLPTGVTEAYVQITDIGPNTNGPSGSPLVSCNGSSPEAPVSYTLFVNRSTAQPVALAPTLGPGGTPSICNADLNSAANSTPTAPVSAPSDVITVTLVGFDYPAYESAYPNSNGNPAPAIAGVTGQSDITISSLIAYQQAAGGDAKLKSFRAKHVLSRATHKITTEI